MKHSNDWYHALAIKLGHPGFVTLAEIRQMLANEPAESGALSLSRPQCFDQIRLLEQRNGYGQCFGGGENRIDLAR